MRDNRRGLALVMSCVVVALVAAYGSATMVRSLTEQRTAQRSVRLASAFQAAEAGLDSAIANLRTNINWSGVGYTSTLKGGYDVAITTLSPTLRRVTATGYYPSNNTAAYGYQRRQVEGTVSVQEPLFNNALFAATTIQLDSGAKTDSYDSSLGSYGGANVSSDGDVGSNSTGSSTVHLDSNAQIKGDASIGPGGNVNTAITLDSNASITGSKQTLVSTKDLASKTYSGGTASGPLTLNSNQEQTLSGGTYTYTFVDLDSNAKVKFSGSATIYVDQYFKLDSSAQFITDSNCPTCTLTIYVKGDTYDGAPPEAVDMDSGSLLSANAKPTQLTVYVTGTGTSARSVQMDSNNGFYGAIHAPLSTVQLDSNVNLYGAAIARSIDLDSNAKVHYDTALASGGSAGGGQVQLLSWREL